MRAAVEAPEPAATPDAGGKTFADLQIRPGETTQQHTARMTARGMGDAQAGWNVGVLGLQQLAGGAAAAVGDAVGSEGVRNWGVDLYKRKEEEIKPYMEGRPTKLEEIDIVRE
jgi:hypothetical protein